jgi:cardiolipin synthase
VAGPPLERGRERAEAAAERARLTFRRLSGLDRSGPPPPETLRDAPWRPWTIPNAITYVRFALLPVFLVLALSSDSGTDALPAIIFAAIAWGDYADGIAARVTGQYSKLGALLDPVIDRALVLAGVVVVWHFETLPRWALAVLAAREVVQLLYGQWALRHGIDLHVNWPGRAAVWPVMSAIFFALVGLETLAEVLLYIGIALAVWATALYIREGSSSR